LSFAASTQRDAPRRGRELGFFPARGQKVLFPAFDENGTIQVDSTILDSLRSRRAQILIVIELGRAQSGGNPNGCLFSFP
jgi:hypothetical protein